jgi:hypothetical protein
VVNAANAVVVVVAAKEKQVVAVAAAKEKRVVAADAVVVVALREVPVGVADRKVEWPRWRSRFRSFCRTRNDV